MRAVGRSCTNPGGRAHSRLVPIRFQPERSTRFAHGLQAPGTWGDGGLLNRGANKVPKEKWCPYNFFRTSNDIQAAWGSVFKNLQSVAPHQPWWGSAGEVVTGPGCFAYPDSLEVGNLKSFAQDASVKTQSEFRMSRSNFGAWVIVSSPLILGHDLTDDEAVDKIWPIIAHRVPVRQL